MRDFSLQMLEHLLLSLKEHKYSVLKFEEYWENRSFYDKKEKVVLLRHDVDRFPKTALETARLEAKHNIFGTYFFRVKSNLFNPKIIKQIHSLGHEIGYHYECFADAKGNYNDALILTNKNLDKLRRITPIVSTSMHSSALSKWDNRLFWEKYRFDDFGILGGAYLSVDHQLYCYIADSGRDWNANRLVIWDFVEGIQPPIMLHGTWGLIKAIKDGKINKMHLLIHPNRWPKTYMGWFFQKYLDFVFNITKKIIIFNKNNKRHINKNQIVL